MLVAYMSDNKPDISNLKNCTEDVRKAIVENEQGPPDPTNYSQLRGRLEASRTRLPPLYRDAFFQPYVNTLSEELGESGFNEMLFRDPERRDGAGLMLDIALTILQNGEAYKE